MFQAFLNCFKIPELRERIFVTLSLLFLARVGANIPLPGVDTVPLQNFFDDQAQGSGGSILGLANMFTGGALLRGAVCALGIMPYISAAIIFQLLGAVVPQLARLQQEGEIGRQKITQYTRYATVAICMVQAVLLIRALESPGLLFPGYSEGEYGQIVLIDNLGFFFTAVVFLTAGTVFLMWLGEQITQKGIGNGISLLITVGIIADLPAALSLTYNLFSAPVGVEQRLGFPQAVIMIVLLFGVTAAIVMVTQGQRKIPVQYAKRVVGRRVMGGQSSFLPLRVNYSGVMPIIFASAILLFFQQIFTWAGSAAGMNFMVDFGNLFNHGQVWYYVIYGTLILGFSYFWVSVMFKPIQIADDLKKYGGYIPGVRPGEPTAQFLDFVMTRLTLAGAIFLVAVAVFPDVILFTYNVPFQAAQFFGGTGMLIIVGVLLDLLRQVETFLLQRHYDGFLQKGRIRGRNVGRSRQPAAVAAGDRRNLKGLFIACAVMFGSGIIAQLVRTWIAG